MTVLRGPADAAHYRVQVGRFHERHYVDPLPSCPIAEAAPDWQAPAWSTVKGAAGKDWSFVTNKRNGHTPQAELTRIAALPDAAKRTKAFNDINKNGLDQAAGRGTIVHLWAEDFLAGRGPRIITDPILFSLKLPRAALDEATEYLEALAAFFDHYQPEVIAAEYVAIHRDLNGHGYGCTPDVIAKVQGQIVGIDWKSRGADSDHGAYPEEAAQIAAGAKAEYMIIVDPDTLLRGRPVRRRLPQIDGGIVVSIKPDGCRIYPTDIDKGFAHVQAMHAFWVARLSEKAAIGKPWPPTPTKETTWTTGNSSTGSPTSTSATPAKPSRSSRTASNTRGTNPANNATTSTSQPTTTEANTSSTTPTASSPADPDDLAFTSHTIATAMTEWSPELRQYLKDWWPADCPNPGQVRRGEAVWTEQQIDSITTLCDLGDAPFWNEAEPVLGRYSQRDPADLEADYHERLHEGAW